MVTGLGRTGTWLGAHQLPIEPDIVAVGKGLGAGHAPLGAVLCRQHVYDVIDRGSREFDLGHTWDGAPLSSAVGLAVLDLMVERGLVERVRDRGPDFLAEVEKALSGFEVVREVRGRGFLVGVELVDPRDGESFLPVEMDVAGPEAGVARRLGVVLVPREAGAHRRSMIDRPLSPRFYARPTPEVARREMAERLATTVEDVERTIKRELSGAAAP